MITVFQKVLRNVLSSYAGNLVAALTQLFLVSFIVARVDLNVYGAALLVVSVLDTMELLRTGMARATYKYLAEYISGPWNETLDRILASSLLVHICIGLISMGVCWGLVPFLEPLFNIPPELADQAGLALKIAGVVICLSFSLRPHVHLFIAYERMDIPIGLGVVGRLSQVLFTVIALLVWDQEILAIVLSILASDLVCQLLNVYYAKRMFGHVVLRPFLASRMWIKRLVRFYLFDSLHPVSETLYRNLSLFVAAQLISLGAVAQLRVLFSVVRLVTVAAAQVGLVLVPTASRLYAAGEKEKVRQGMIEGTSATVYMGGITLVGLVPWVYWLLFNWVGQEFVSLTMLAVLMLCSAFVRHTTSCIHGSLVGLGYVTWDGLSDLVSTILGVCVGLMLLFFVEPTLINLGLGLVTADLMRGFSLIVYGTRIFKVGLFDFLWNAYARAVALISLLIAGISLLNIPAPDWFRLILLGCLGAAIFAVLGFFLVLPQSMRIRLYEAVISVWRSIAGRLGKKPATPSNE